MNRDIDAIDSVFVPDLLTPTQYFDSKRRDSSDDPLKRLMMAVLQDAIHCYQDGADNGSVMKRKKFYEVKEWFFDDSSDGPFSFAVVCEALNFLPDYLRFGLAQLQTAASFALAGARQFWALSRYLSLEILVHQKRLGSFGRLQISKKFPQETENPLNMKSGIANAPVSRTDRRARPAKLLADP